MINSIADLEWTGFMSKQDDFYTLACFIATYAWYAWIAITVGMYGSTLVRYDINIRVILIQFYPITR